jgi:Mrp family chromosome partitioning ATPase
MGFLIQRLRDQADMVLFDSPPTLVFADAAVLSTRVDGVILINDMGHTRTNEAGRAADELRRVHANLLGVVLNRVDTRQGDNNYYYYYYREDGEKRKSSRTSLTEFINRMINRQVSKKQAIPEKIAGSSRED